MIKMHDTCATTKREPEPAFVEKYPSTGPTMITSVAGSPASSIHPQGDGSPYVIPKIESYRSFEPYLQYALLLFSPYFKNHGYIRK
jgi:hypothetical protein